MQTVENLIRRRVGRRLIWFCTVCRCPTKKTFGLYGLIVAPIMMKNNFKVHYIEKQIKNNYDNMSFFKSPNFDAEYIIHQCPKSAYKKLTKI